MNYVGVWQMGARHLDPKVARVAPDIVRGHRR